jgi:uncharacterized membrane protein
MMGWGYGYGFGLLHMIIWLVILTAIVAGVWLVRTGALQFAARRSPGRQVLEERYVAEEARHFRLILSRVSGSRRLSLTA